MIRGVYGSGQIEQDAGTAAMIGGSPVFMIQYEAGNMDGDRLVNRVQLKRLEAYGFKSFADKIEIEFNQGITAIVGPNGSGKSNITDAIRWVLGEQNVRNLRGTKAEDIIFTGSAARRALGVAEVSLVFDNDGSLPVDFKEVVVTRRLFRSGESEFYINKSRCRLKDIYNLFADTGLGHDGMSVISQNKIDVILNSRPEERRLFFEETAGITKYRSRKREAVRKLENTEQNLVRVMDIIHEIENQLEPLAAQAERTQKYNVLQADYKRCHLTGLYHKYEQLDAELKSGSLQLEQYRDQEIAAQTEARKVEAQKEQLSQILVDTEKALQSLAEKNSELRSRMETNHSEMAILTERGTQSDVLRQRILSQRAALMEQTAAAEAEINRLGKEAAAQQKQLVDAGALLLSQQQKAAGLGSQIRSQKDACHALDIQKQELQQQLMAKQNEQTLIERDIAANRASSQTRGKSLAEAKEQLQMLRLEHEAMQRKILSSREESQKLEADRENLRQQLLAISQEVRQLQQEIQQLVQQHQNAISKLQFLQKMQQSYEGFGRAAKSVLKSQASWSRGICGAVAELLQVPKEYITAIEIALGNGLQNIVTEDTDTAKQAIAFLKKEHLGRVTFLPLSSIVVRKPNAGHEIQDEGVLGYASELVGAEPKYRRVVDFLLARTLVVDTIDHALALAKKEGYRLRIVTLEGELLNPGGSLSGGSRQHRETSFLNRSGEIESLQQLAADTAKELSESRSKQQKKNDLLQKEEQEAHRQDEQLQALAVRQAELRVADERMEAQIREKEEQLKQLEQLASELQLTFARAQQQRIQVVHEVKALEQREQILDTKTTAAYEQLDDMEQDADDLGKYINECSLKKAVLEQGVLHSQEGVLLRQREAKRLQQELLKNRQEETDMLQRLQEDRERLKVLQQDNERWQELYEQGQQEHKRSYEAKMQKLAESQKVDKAAKEAARELNTLQAKLHKLDVAVAEMQLRRQQCEESLQEEYGLVPEEAATQILPLAADEIQRRMERLEKTLHELGAVNPNAPAEYEETRNRHAFMQKQSGDLVAAKDNLLEILHEVDLTMTRQFKAAFARINEYFGDIFVRLFGGGQAELLLTDKEHVLDAGVEILVQLPEKKRQNLTALSGGERALTVIALLFSFLRYRPSPFSVLDEIDAPLDEANIARFGSFLQEYAEHTQFIVVTHRKGTMEAADTMYGVTIEDAGVSRIVSVRLDEAV